MLNIQAGKPAYDGNCTVATRIAYKTHPPRDSRHYPRYHGAPCHTYHTTTYSPHASTTWADLRRPYVWAWGLTLQSAPTEGGYHLPLVAGQFVRSTNHASDPVAVRWRGHSWRWPWQ